MLLNCKERFLRVRDDPHYSHIKEELLHHWDECCEGKDVPPLPYSSYRLFWINGNRTIYEAPYFLRREILIVSAICALVYPEEKKYVEKLEDVLFDICNEYSWCLPAHQGDGDVLNAAVVDLFAAETAFALAECYTLMADRLSPLVRQRILREIRVRVIDSTLENTNGWRWERMTNNWAAVCGGCVGCVAMLLFKEEFYILKPRIDNAIKNFLSGFGEDGVCLEGINYWIYGFGFFTVYADMLCRFTDGNENLFHSEKVKKIAAFPTHIILTEKTVAGFSDAHRECSFPIFLFHYLKKVYPDEVKLLPLRYRSNITEQKHFSYSIRDVLWYEPELADKNELMEGENFVFFESSQWYINKKSGFAFAAKGGTNREPHNHNDVGTFIIAKDSRQIFIDTGGGVYTKDYFDKTKRYEIFEPSSLSHNVPIINGKPQLFGEACAATKVKATPDFFELDITKAYGECGVDSVTRRFDIKDDGVVLTDIFSSVDAEIIERFVFLQKPSIIDSSTVVIDGVTLLLGNESVMKVTRVEGSRENYYTLDIKVEGEKTFTCTIKP